MNKKKLALEAIEILERTYPEAVCSLDSGSALELLISTRLAAQCTDARVNMVTPALFRRFPDAGSFAAAEPAEVEEYIKSCGLYKTKARDIVACCRMLCEEYGGEVPGAIEELVKLPGVGRKTANLVVGDIFGQPAVVCDTHCIRITNLLGLADSRDPAKVEKQLREILPPDKSNDFCHRIVLFGREYCVARRPRCSECPLKGICVSCRA